MVDVKKWRFWQLFDEDGIDDGRPVWVAVSRPDAHARIDRVKLWTLIPSQQRLIANWYVSQDHQLPPEQRRWVHDSITGWDFCDAAIEVPEPSVEDRAALARPEAVLTFDQIDDVALVKVVGKREYDRIWDGRAG